VGQGGVELGGIVGVCAEEVVGEARRQCHDSIAGQWWLQCRR
jgi:hypothetical protein